jgi:hypothetical protein
MQRVGKLIKCVVLSLFLPLAFVEAATLEVRGNLFFHTSQKFRQVYGSSASDLQVEFTTPINSNSIDVWGNFSWSPKAGACGCCDSFTRIKIYNTSIGMNYTIPGVFEEADAYVGLGVSISGVVLKNRSFCVTERVSKCAPGIIFKTGFIRYLTSNYYLNVFCDYLYQPVFYRHTVDVGGLKPGIGIGYDF